MNAQLEKEESTLFIAKPNLPQNKVTSLFLGEKYVQKFSGPLWKLGVKALPVPPCESLSGEERHHADMLLHHIGKNGVIVHKGMLGKAKCLYKEMHMEIVDSEVALQKDYPYNIALNGLSIGSLFFHNLKFTDSSIKSQLISNNCKLIHVRQGYAKCAVAVVDEGSAITSDNGMAAALECAGIDVLLIRPGFIFLDSEHYGFIGGCCGKLSKDRIAFTGSLNDHPDKNKILNFLETKKVYPVFLTEGPLIDVGSILPLKEEDRRIGNNT